MTVMGIDSSTGGIAWTVVQHGSPYAMGKINTTKLKDITDKLAFGIDHFKDLLQLYKPDIVVVEKSIYVNNRATFRTLSYIVGAIMATAKLEVGADVYDVEPMAWKSLYGYTTMTKKMELLARRTLERTAAAKVCEALKKEQTMRVIKHNFGLWKPEEDTDIWDSTGIALWGWHNYVQRLELQVSKEIAFGDKYDLFR